MTTIATLAYRLRTGEWKTMLKAHPAPGVSVVFAQSAIDRRVSKLEWTEPGNLHQAEPGPTRTRYFLGPINEGAPFESLEAVAKAAIYTGAVPS